MTWALLLALTLVTVASRVLPMAFLPTPRGRAARVLDALPAPLFASLAALALVGDGDPPALPVLVATAAALLGATRRSLALTLVCGITGFFLGQALLHLVRTDHIDVGRWEVVAGAHDGEARPFADDVRPAGPSRASITMPSSTLLAADTRRATAASSEAARPPAPGSPRMMATAAEVSTTTAREDGAVTLAGRRGRSR